MRLVARFGLRPTTKENGLQFRGYLAGQEWVEERMWKLRNEPIFWNGLLLDKVLVGRLLWI